MKRLYLFLLLALVLGFTGIAGYEVMEATRQRAQLAGRQETSEWLSGEIAKAKSENAVIARDLAQAERQLAEIEATHAADKGASGGQQGEITAWLGRVKRLRHLFEEKAGQVIPEMSLLTDQDWLRVAKTAKFESEEDIRRAMALIRDAAVGRFSQSLSEAMRKFVKTVDAQTEPNIQSLNAFMTPPADAAMLARYQLTATTLPPPRGQVWKLQNKAPVDPEYDSAFRYDADPSGRFGMSSGPGLTGWIPDLGGRLMEANREFQQVKKGVEPESIADVIPYIKPPLEPAQAQALVREWEAKKKASPPPPPEAMSGR